jgi:hypothetical protein
MSKKDRTDKDEQTDIHSDRSVLQRIKEKSEDDFEKKITYISAGSLAISLTFIEKIVPLKESIEIWLLISSWTLLALTLLLNLLSHLYSSHIMDKSLDDDEKNDYKKSLINWKRRRMKITIWNLINVTGLIFGIALFIIFVSINVNRAASHGDKDVMQKELQKQPTKVLNDTDNRPIANDTIKN